MNTIIISASRSVLATGLCAVALLASCKKPDLPNTLPPEPDVEVATEISFTASAPQLGFAAAPSVAISLNGATPVSVRDFELSQDGSSATFYAVFAEDVEETRTFNAYSPYGAGFTNAAGGGVNAVIATSQEAMPEAAEGDEAAALVNNACALAFATVTIDDNQAEEAELAFNNVDAYGRLVLDALPADMTLVRVEVIADAAFAGSFAFDPAQASFTATEASVNTIEVIPAAASQRVLGFVCAPVNVTSVTVKAYADDGSSYTGLVSVDGFASRSVTEIRPSALMSLHATDPASVYVGHKANIWQGEITVAGVPEGTPISYRVDYSTDGGETWGPSAPAWLVGLENGRSTSFTATIENSVIQTVNPLAWLRSQASVGSDSAPFDLSTNGGRTAMTTANTYVINAPGVYSLPLVYGNAVQNGEVVEDSFHYTGDWHQNLNTGATTAVGNNLERLVNYLDKGIMSAYIYEDGISPASAGLVWQQVQGLVKNVRLSSDKKSLLFEIDKDKIAEGNAVVAVRDAEGRTIWSWQIWVSCWVPGTHLVRVTTPYRNTSDFAPVNVGWVNQEDIKICEARSVKVRFTLDGIGLTDEKTIYVAGGYITGAGLGSYYQWGRKDPVWLSAGSGKKPYMNEVRYYDAFGAEISLAAGEPGTLGSGIQTPGQMLKNRTATTGKRQFYDNGGDHGFNNLWNAAGVFEGGKANSESAVFIKTVYDPSPAMYQVPSNNGLMCKKDGQQLAAKDAEIVGHHNNADDPHFYFVVDKTTALTLIETGSIAYTADKFESGATFRTYCASMSNGLTSDSAYDFNINGDTKVQTTIVPNAALPVRPCTNRTIAE